MYNKSPPKILLVDDERDLSKLIENWLVEDSYVVDCAYDGMEALEKISTTAYDLLILDVMLPAVDGTDICSIVRSENSHIPIVTITAYNSQAREKMSFDCGASAYMAKPFELKALSNCIRDLLDADSHILSKVS